MEVTVMSFLYALLIAMGLSGASYNDIANAFPDNTAQQNSVLYSIANDPTMNTGGFEFVPGETLPTNAVEIWEIPFRDAVNEYLQTNFNALMDHLGFAVVQNNIDVAVDAGFDPEFTGTKSAVVSIGGILGGVYIWGYTDNGGNWGSLAPYGVQGDAPNWWDYPVIKLEYNGETRYCTALKLGAAPEYGVNVGYEGSFQYPPFELWTSDGKLYIRNSRYIPGQITVDTFRRAGFDIPYDDFVSEGAVNVGEDLLGFGDTDNPIVGVTYDPATGVTTYKYKDGTTRTTPPAVLGDSIALSPSITQPLTNYIINEGDITNIYQPDAAIPSDSSIPFDFTSLGDLIYKEFTPVATFDFKPPYNRLINKYDWETPFRKICQKFNITGRRPSYVISFVWFNQQVSFDVWCWCDYILDSRGYSLYMKFMKFFLYFGMVTGCILLFLRSINVKLGTVVFEKG